jgi:hypothetical protein
MSSPARCSCDKPLLEERSEQKGVSESYCGRCKKPIGLRSAVVKTA